MLRFFTFLLKRKIKVDVYKVADVNVSGKYTEPTEGAVSVSKELYSVLEESLGKVTGNTRLSTLLKSNVMEHFRVVSMPIAP